MWGYAKASYRSSVDTCRHNLSATSETGTKSLIFVSFRAVQRKTRLKDYV